MKTIFLVIVLAMGLLVFSGADNPVGASSSFPASMDGQGIQPIRALKRSSSDSGEPDTEIRDPFASPPATVPRSEQPPVAAVSVQSHSAPSLPAFKILGKQEDEEGWSVFISTPDKSGQVWVVREGETFNEAFRISRLAPPILIIKNLRSQQSRTFNIGKDEE